MALEHIRVALLGDSVFDNAAYTSGEPDVVSHLRRLLPSGSTATLCAVDGATTSAINAQLRRIPDNATHLVVSVGGNDALQNIDLLSLRVASSAEALQQFAARIDAFERAYRTGLLAVLERGLPVIVCTIYNGALEESVRSIARLGVALFNDVIFRTAFSLRLDVIDLRTICNAPSDYANPIEPSGSGGLKIADAIAVALGVAQAPAPSRVWSGEV